MINKSLHKTSPRLWQETDPHKTLLNKKLTSISKSASFPIWFRADANKSTIMVYVQLKHQRRRWIYKSLHKISPQLWQEHHPKKFDLIYNF